MSKGNQTELDILAKLFNKTALPFDAITDLYVSLHTGSPEEDGDQSTLEVTYGSYARVAVARSVAGWNVIAGQVSNAAAILFPACSGGSCTATHVAVGTSASGAGQILYFGPLMASLSISAGVQPQIAAGTLMVTED